MKKSQWKRKPYKIKIQGMSVQDGYLVPKPLKRGKLNKVSKQTTSKLQKKCDSLLTPIIKKLRPRCEGCGGETQVAHHWKEKSISSYLRYEIDNLVSLCHSCHAKIHNRFGNSVTGSCDIADIVIKKRGVEWKIRMDSLSKKSIKINRLYYEEKLKILTDLYEKYLD